MNEYNTDIYKDTGIQNSKQTKNEQIKKTSQKINNEYTNLIYFCNLLSNFHSREIMRKIYFIKTPLWM